MTARFALALALPLALAACGGASEASDPPANGEIAGGERVVAEIEAAVADSVEGWNEGHFERFLGIYSAAPETTFVGSGGVVRGREQIGASYGDQHDWLDPSARGELDIERLDFRMLSDDHALYIGRYTLTFDGDREPATGPTSLVFAREDEGWRVIADHSS